MKCLSIKCCFLFHIDLVKQYMLMVYIHGCIWIGGQQLLAGRLLVGNIHNRNYKCVRITGFGE